jgi:maltooligosyltrehalose trehalohydrolase
LDDRLEAVQTRLDESARWLAVERGPITIVCLVSEHAQRVPVRPGEQVILLASDNSIRVESGGVMMPPDSVAVLTKR